MCVTPDATLLGGIVGCFRFSRYLLCVSSHYWIWDGSRRN